MTTLNRDYEQSHQKVTLQVDEGKVEEIKKSLHSEAQELFARSLRGGIFGVFLTESFPFYFVSPQLLEEYGMQSNSFYQAFGEGLLSMVHPEERASYQLEFVMSMKEGRIFDRISKMVLLNHECYMRDVAKKVVLEDGSELACILRSNVTETMEYQIALTQEASNFAMRNNTLEEVTVQIPCAVCKVRLEDHLKLEFANDEFYNLLKYTKEQLIEEKATCLDTMIYSEEHDPIFALLDQKVKHKEKVIELEHRMVRRDGTIIWLLVKGYFSYEKQTPELTCSFMDITKRKQMEEAAKISEERFRIALAVTDSTIFEYDIKTKVMIHGDRSAIAYGLQHRTENVPESLLERGTVHEESADDFLRMYHQIQTGEKMASCLVRVNEVGIGYVWRKIIMTNIFDEQGQAVQAIGVLEDVDEQVKREQALRYQTEIDPLTGLYNRRYMIDCIKENLKETTNTKKAIMIIDIDNFKQVNDQNGHMYGDFVLSESAKRVQSEFHHDVYIGRIGGDEFFAFFTNIESHDMAQAYAMRIIQNFHEEFCNRGVHQLVTCSVGFAMFPDDGASFEMLYQNADLALYEAKKSGKNKAMGYTTSMVMPNGCIPYSDSNIEN